MSGDQGENKPKKPRSKKKVGATVGVILVVVIAAGAGFMVWHDTPSFCDAICHKSMDGYRPTYEATPGEPGEDKWGNEVSDARAMLASAHREYGELVCVDCHVPSTLEQAVEGIEFLGDSYVAPLEERSLDDVMYYRGSNILQYFSYEGTELASEEFCLNDSCHRLTMDDLVATTANYPVNPHQWAVDTDASCSDCHKAHRASIMACEGNEDYLPAGWLTATEAEQLDNQRAAFTRE